MNIMRLALGLALASVALAQIEGALVFEDANGANCEISSDGATIETTCNLGTTFAQAQVDLQPLQSQVDSIHQQTCANALELHELRTSTDHNMEVANVTIDGHIANNIGGFATCTFNCDGGHTADHGNHPSVVDETCRPCATQVQVCQANKGTNWRSSFTHEANAGCGKALDDRTCDDACAREYFNFPDGDATGCDLCVRAANYHPNDQGTGCTQCGAQQHPNDAGDACTDCSGLQVPNTDGTACANYPGGYVPLQGWYDYAGSYGTAKYHIDNGVCFVEGLVRLSGTATTGTIGTLPPQCRPTKRLIYSLNHHQHTNRVDVLPDGRIILDHSHEAHAWQSLTGISFPLTQGTALTYESGWSDYGGSYNGASYKVIGDVCHVEGLVTKASTAIVGYIATLPAECRPTMRLIFNMNHHEHANRVDVLPDGRIQLHHSHAAHAWQSLSGISFPTSASAINLPACAPSLVSTADGQSCVPWTYRAYQFDSGWYDYGSSYGNAAVHLKGGVCSIEGLVRKASTATVGYIGTLPLGCRPAKRLIFSMNHHQHTNRVDVLTDGRVQLHHSHEAHAWQSLSSISFPVTQGTALTLGSGWSDYGESYDGASYTVLNGVCHIEGLVSMASTATVGLIATLPAECRPAKRLIFSGNHHQHANRVDVKTNGQIYLDYSNGAHSWQSLSGISFPLTQGTALTLESGWSDYGESYNGASYKVIDGRCYVEGLVRKASTATAGDIATLPAECRPNQRLIFNLNHHQHTNRVDVLPDGRIQLHHSHAAHSWQSLAGINFRIGFD